MRSILTTTLKIGLSLAIGAVCLFVVFYQLDWRTTIQTILSVNQWWALAAAAALAIGCMLKWLRWHITLLTVYPELRASQSTGPFFIGIAFNALAPIKIGEVVRLVSISRTSALSKSKVLSTILVERAFDGLALALLLLTASWFVALPRWVMHILMAGSVFFVGLLAILYVAVFSKNTAQWFRQINRFAILNRLLHALEKGIDALHILRRKKDLLKLGITSVSVWIFESAMYLFFFKAFNIELGIVPAIIVMAILNFGVLVLTAPGSMGTFEFLITKGLALFSVGHSQALAFALVVHVFLYVPFILIGYVYFLKQGIRWRELIRTSAVSPD